MKSLKEISWLVDEPTYRADPALSYSTLAKYERGGGFNSIPSLQDKIETPSLTFGSAVDSIITGGDEEFNERFVVMDFPEISDNLIAIARTLYRDYKEKYRSIDEIPTSILSAVGASCEYYANPKYDNYRVKMIKENCQNYYNLLYAAGEKTILDTKTADSVFAAVRALKDMSVLADPTSVKYFEPDNPFEPEIEHLYQLKFKATFDNVPYRCMADLIIVDHKRKVVIPCDLKTSSHYEWDFHTSFLQWRYDIQARLYWQIIRANMDKDEEFKDYRLLDYRFIVVNKKTLKPLVWGCPFTQAIGTINFGKDNHIEMRHPFEIGTELYHYLLTQQPLPDGIVDTHSNDLRTWLNKL